MSKGSPPLQNKSRDKQSMNQNSFQGSRGYQYNFFDSNSLYYSKLRDDSISIDRLFDEQPPTFNYFYHQDTLNFRQISSMRLRQEGFDEQMGHSEPQEWAGELSTSPFRKGLKDLAKLLLQLIKNNTSFSQSEIVKFIQTHLCHFKRQHQQQHKKNEKNVKRRIYDALNVMISAGLLERGSGGIRIRPKTTVGMYSERFQGEVFERRGRIQKKRQLLNKLNTQKKAISYWIRHNQYVHSNAKTRLSFPLIFVLNKSRSKEIQIAQNSSMLILFSPKLQFLSETDIIQQIYRQQQSQKYILEDLTLQLPGHL